ncbi:hypothetical protein HanIR_Chr16g0810941 [Helianthus annuus]|nr:hypothetical protein HanIR_Chr16g0810941 [Helianthus annuus]
MAQHSAWRSFSDKGGVRPARMERIRAATESVRQAGVLAQQRSVTGKRGVLVRRRSVTGKRCVLGQWRSVPARRRVVSSKQCVLTRATVFSRCVGVINLFLFNENNLGITAFAVSQRLFFFFFFFLRTKLRDLCHIRTKFKAIN